MGQIISGRSSGAIPSRRRTRDHRTARVCRAFASSSTRLPLFSAPDGVCDWDLKVKYDDGDEATWKGLNLCSISKVTLYWDKKKEVTRAVTE